jgi:hypothetical protein
MNSVAVATLASDEDLLVIEGKNPENRRFRPSDWSERLASNFACFGTDHRLRYSPLIYPVLIDGIPCLMVAKHLEKSDPAAYAFIMQFAVENNLCVREDRRQGPRVIETERRKDKPGVQPERLSNS